MKRIVCAGAALCLLAAGQAAAQEPWYAAKSDGDWLVRLRGIAVAPDESLTLDQVAGADAKVDTAYVPELDISYFFTPNLALELILATTPHDVAGRGAIDGADLGDVWLLPPTLTAQYHVTQLGDWTGNPSLGKVKQYFGAGVNYTIFYSEDASPALVGAIGPTTVDLDDSVGFAVQAGVDIDINERFFFNADIKYVDMDTTATLFTPGVGLTPDVINTVDVDLNPIIAGVGFGMRF